MNQTANKIDISLIDLNPNGWVQELITSNGVQSVSDMQDKISAIYLLHHHNMLKPVTVVDIYNMSNDLSDAIANANGYNNENHLVNKLSTIIILGNLGVLDSVTMQYISNPQFKELFLSNMGKLVNLFKTGAQSLSSMLTDSASVTQSMSPRVTQLSPTRVSQAMSPRVSQAMSPRVNQLSPPRVTQPMSPRVNQLSPPRVTQPMSPRVNQLSQPMSSQVNQLSPPRVTQPMSSRVNQLSQPMSSRVNQLSSQQIDQLSSPRVSQSMSSRVSQSMSPQVSQLSQPRVNQLSRQSSYIPVTSKFNNDTIDLKYLSPTNKLNSQRDEYKYRLCQMCDAHIYTDSKICGLCDDESLIPPEIEEEIQIDYYGAPNLDDDFYKNYEIGFSDDYY